MKHKSNLFFLILLVVFTVPSILGLLHAGFPLTDDGNWMVIRFSAFYEALRSGQFPVRFLERLNNGYGYPVADFLYPLFMYIGVPIHVLGFSFADTIKMLVILSLISSSIFSYLWLKKVFDNLSSLVGSVFYTLFPYLLFDVYTRGSVGEVLALAILPFVLWQIERKNLLLISLGIGALILSHNTLAFLFIPFIAGYIFIRNKRFSKFNLLSILLGFGISSFFWIPAIYDLQYTVFSKTKVSDFSQYFIDKNPGLLGVALVFLILESIFYLIRKKDKLFFVLFLVFLIFIFLTISYSEIFWKISPLTGLIQFPFRIISLIIPLGAFMTAFLLSKEKDAKKNILVVIYLILIFVSAYAFMFPKNYQTFPDTFYSTNQDTTTVRNEYMPIWVKNIPQKMASAQAVNLNGGEKINVIKKTANQTVFEIFLNNSSTIEVNTLYFPGWVAYVNGEKTNIDYKNSQGLISLRLNKGVNNVVLKFEETGVRILSDILSVFGIILAFVIYYLNKRKKINI